MKRLSVKRIIEICIFAGLLALAVVRLFYKLGNGALNVTDEAWYGVNAYEMLNSGNWLVPTLRHQIDYASKPPLGLWGILLGFKLFGVNKIGLRMYSAVAGLLTVVLLSGYLCKKKGIKYAIVATAAFSALWQCFELHMYRAGDMDALFCLFYLIAVIALAEVASGKQQMVILYGLSVGLGFMTKSMHVTVFIVVGILFLPVIWKKLKVKDVILTAVAALLPNLLWIMARYPYDGFEYIKCITLGEAGDQTRSGITFEYLGDIAREKVTWVLTGFLLVRIVLYFIGLSGKKDRSFKQILTDLGAYCKDKYLLILALWVPIVFYTLAGHHMLWYIDPAYIGMIWMIAVEAVEVSEKLKSYSKAAGMALGCAAVAFCVLYASIQLGHYKLLGTGGRSIDQFGIDIAEFRDNTSAEYDGYKAYIAYDRQRFVGDRGHWELDFVFCGNTIGGLECVDGGVEGFLADEDSLLVMDSELWDEYAGVLTGYVFLEQNTYYVLSHDRY